MGHEKTEVEKILDAVKSWAADVTSEKTSTGYLGTSSISLPTHPMNKPVSLVVQLTKPLDFVNVPFSVHNARNQTKLSKTQDQHRQRVQSLKVRIDRDKKLLKELINSCSHVVTSSGQCKICGSHPPRVSGIAY